MDGERSYRLIVPMKVGNCRAPARGGHRTHWREGGAQADVSGEGTIAETLISVAMSPSLARLSVLAHRDVSSGSGGGESD